MKSRFFAAALCACGALVSCDRQPTPPAAAPNAAPASRSPADPALVSGGAVIAVQGLKFPLAPAWKSVPPANKLRIAEVLVPESSGDAAKACTIAFSTAGGSLASNVARWAAQVKDASGKPVNPATQIMQIAGLKISTVEFRGSYEGMGEGPAKPDWILRGSIIESPQGMVFVKMTGPAPQMKAAADTYRAMIEGIQR